MFHTERFIFVISIALFYAIVKRKTADYSIVFSFAFFRERKKRTVERASKAGKTTAERIPNFIFPLYDETSPTRVGPDVQPISPARARKANSVVPPRGSVLDAVENVPGQAIPMAKPHKPHAMRLKTAFGTSVIKRYETVQRIAQIGI